MSTFYHTECTRTSRFSGNGGHCGVCGQRQQTGGASGEGSVSSHGQREALQLQKRDRHTAGDLPRGLTPDMSTKPLIRAIH